MLLEGVDLAAKTASILKVSTETILEYNRDNLLYIIQYTLYSTHVMLQLLLLTFRSDQIKMNEKNVSATDPNN